MNGNNLRISAGTYAGEAMVHNEEEIEIVGGKVTYRLQSRFPDPAHPNIERQQVLTPDEVRELKVLADAAAAKKLPTRVGIPDAADQGGEWLEILGPRGKVRIDLERGAEVPEIGALLERLRTLRQTLSRRYRPPE